MKTLAIKDWDATFETFRSRRIKGPLEWFHMPAARGIRYLRIMRAEGGPAAYGVFCAICLMTAKTEHWRRGWLVDDTGQPHDAESIAIAIGADLATVESAIKILSDPMIGWLIESDQQPKPDTSGAHPSRIHRASTSHPPDGCAVDGVGMVRGCNVDDRVDKRREEEIREETPLYPPLRGGQGRNNSDSAVEHFPPGVTEPIRMGYPTSHAPRAARIEIANALLRIQTGEDRPDTPPPDWPPKDPRLWLAGRVAKYAASAEAKRVQFVPTCANWMKAARYLEPDENWEQTRDEKRTDPAARRAAQRGRECEPDAIGIPRIRPEQDAPIEAVREPAGVK